MEAINVRCRSSLLSTVPRFLNLDWLSQGLDDLCVFIDFPFNVLAGSGAGLIAELMKTQQARARCQAS
jgi:hypothetical protein